MIYFVGIVIVYFLHVLLQLNWEVTLVLFLYVVLMIPFHKKRYKKGKEYQLRFFEVSLYLDTILYAFVKEEKVDLAIQDVSMTLPRGKMKDLVLKAEEYIKMTFDEVELLEEGLKIIEKEYPCQRMKTIHQFMTHVEYYGGEIERPVNLLLADKGRWEQRIRTAMEQRKKQMLDVILSVIASIVICAAILHLPIANMDISGEIFVQLCGLFVLVIDDVIIFNAQKFLCVDWIGLQLTEEESYYVKKMEDYQKYDEKKEKRLSILLGISGLVVLGVAWYMNNEWLTAIFMAVTLFLFQQHRVGRTLERKNIIKQIKYAFPNWLLDIVLLLQSENVQMALQKSQEHVPGILQKELYLLNERLEMEPEASEPYHKFLEEFEMPEVHSAMGILYSLSIGNSGNADKQINELVEKNLELLDETETELLKNAGSGMYALFLLPVVVASFKLIVDMLFMLLHFVRIPIV